MLVLNPDCLLTVDLGEKILENILQEYHKFEAIRRHKL